MLHFYKNASYSRVFIVTWVLPLRKIDIIALINVGFIKEVKFGWLSAGDRSQLDIPSPVQLGSHAYSPIFSSFHMTPGKPASALNSRAWPWEIVVPYLTFPQWSCFIFLVPSATRIQFAEWGMGAGGDGQRPSHQSSASFSKLCLPRVHLFLHFREESGTTLGSV